MSAQRGHFDRRMRLVLIAVDRVDAREWIAAQPWIDPAEVTTVTRRSPHGARGVTANAVLITPAAADLPNDVLDDLRAETLPCVMSRRAEL